MLMSRFFIYKRFYALSNKLNINYNFINDFINDFASYKSKNKIYLFDTPYDAILYFLSNDYIYNHSFLYKNNDLFICNSIDILKINEFIELLLVKRDIFISQLLKIKELDSNSLIYSFPHLNEVKYIDFNLFVPYLYANINNLKSEHLVNLRDNILNNIFFWNNKSISELSIAKSITAITYYNTNLVINENNALIYVKVQSALENKPNFLMDKRLLKTNIDQSHLFKRYLPINALPYNEESYVYIWLGFPIIANTSKLLTNTFIILDLPLPGESYKPGIVGYTIDEKPIAHLPYTYKNFDLNSERHFISFTNLYKFCSFTIMPCSFNLKFIILSDFLNGYIDFYIYDELKFTIYSNTINKLFTFYGTFIPNFSTFSHIQDMAYNKVKLDYFNISLWNIKMIPVVYSNSINMNNKENLINFLYYSLANFDLIVYISLRRIYLIEVLHLCNLTFKIKKYY